MSSNGGWGWDDIKQQQVRAGECKNQYYPLTGSHWLTTPGFSGKGEEPNTNVGRVCGVHSIRLWRAVRSFIFDYSVEGRYRLDWRSALHH